MDVKTLTVVVALVASALAMLMVVLAVYRRQISFSVYAAGFVGGTLGLLLLLGQGQLPLWLSVLVSNALIVLFHTALPWGLRLGVGVRPAWPARFWAYAVAWLVVEVGATLVWPSYVVRSFAASVMFILMAGEFLSLVGFRLRHLPWAVRVPAFTVGGLFILGHLVRLVLVAGEPAGASLFTGHPGISAFSLLFSAVFSVLWGGIVVVIEVSGQFNRLEQKNDHLRKLALTDELTGLANRHRLEAVMESEMERSQRYGQPLSLILFDLDHFKEINDAWGHPVGDQVLRQAADLVGGLIRSPDSLYRWGGEEFMLLSPQTAREGAIGLAEKLRQVLEAQVFPGAGRITASFGVASWQAPDTRDQWLAKVDLALYRAKDGGRNRVVAWEESEALPGDHRRVEWRTEWDTGNQQVDQEHRHLLSLANALLECSVSMPEDGLVERLLDELLDHVTRHFAEEERILASVRYPHLAEHATLHRKLETEARELRTRLRGGKAEADSFFQFLISRVVVGHMLTADARLAAYTRSAVKA